MTAPIRIAQLYPTTLGITGDRGNARALEQRLVRAGIPAEHLTIEQGEPIPADTDILVFGNGPLSAMRRVLDDLRSRVEQLKSFVDEGRPLLAVGGSAELLGHDIALVDGTHLPGLGVLPYRVARTRERRVGYILADSPLGRIVGFEDHASQWTLDDPANGVATVTEGNGSFAAGEHGGEIVRFENAFATNVQGPALPLNPAWTIEILRTATDRRGIEWDTAEGAARLDEYAAEARATIERLLHGRGFNAIQV